MQLTIAGHFYTFMPLQAFRSQWGLPDDFSLAHFEPKDWQGLGRLDGSGPVLAAMRERLVAAVPATVTLMELMPQVEALAELFRHELEVANQQINLRQVEVDFAVAGFQDVMQGVVYHLIQLRHRVPSTQLGDKFDFLSVYQAWLDASVRVAALPQTYVQAGHQFEVRVVYNAYGRVGLEVGVAGEVYYVADPALACPAASYMFGLGSEVAQALCAAFIYPA